MLQREPTPQNHRQQNGVTAAFGIIGRFPVLIPLGLITLFAQITYSGINNVGVPQYIGVLKIPNEGKVIATLTVAFLLAETFLRMPFGWLSDRFGRVLVVSGAMLLSVPTVLLSGLVPGYQWLYGLRAWDGMMAAALWPSVYAIVGDSIPERVRANAMGVINMMYMLALFIGGALGLFVFKLTGNPRTFFFFGAALFGVGGLLALLFFRLRPDLNAPHPEAHLEEAACGVVTMARHLTLLTITFTQTFAITALAPFMIRYVTDPISDGGLGFNMAQLALLVGAPVVGVGVFALPLSRLSDALGKLTAVRIAFVGIAVMLWIFSRYQQLPVLALTAMVIGVAFSMGVPAWLAILSSLTGCKSRGMALAGYGTVQGIASVLGPLASGWVWDHVGHRQIFLLSAIFITVAALLALFALPSESNRTQNVDKTV
ncbi:MAG: MFS transporter [Armatimonadota bacterium]